MPKISLPQKNLVLDAPVEVNLMTFLLAQQVPVASSCLGDGICSKCRVAVVGVLPPASELEANTLKRNRCEEGERLSCQIVVAEDLQIRAKYW